MKRKSSTILFINDLMFDSIKKKKKKKNVCSYHTCNNMRLSNLSTR